MHPSGGSVSPATPSLVRLFASFQKWHFAVAVVEPSSGGLLPFSHFGCKGDLNGVPAESRNGERGGTVISLAIWLEPNLLCSPAARLMVQP